MNTVIAAERARIMARAAELLLDELLANRPHAVADALVAEFGISPDRAKRAANKAWRIACGHEVRRQARPATYGIPTTVRIDDDDADCVAAIQAAHPELNGKSACIRHALPWGVVGPGLLEMCRELFTLLEEHEPEWYTRGHYNHALAILDKAERLTE